MRTHLLLVGLLALASFAAAAAENPVVLIKTEKGDITVEVDLARAPVTAANFLRYVDGKLYDGSIFHRTVTLANQPKDAVRIEVLQGGMLSEDKGFPPIAHETTATTGLKHLDGTISMARGTPGSATSSFFFCINDQPELDLGGKRNPDGQGFAAFGRVVGGMDVVKAIHVLPAEGQSLKPPVKIISVRRIDR
ncbi:MAG: peptidylprolyl isomerase [Candidatus Aminicenantes bacterium]|nr:peptidylprolyl isomerase [Candidatus Aminicenantes bacterium]